MSQEQRIEIGPHRASLRVRVGLTQAGLAEKAGVGVSTVTRAEDGGELRESNLRALAAALGITAREYLEPDGYAALAAPVHEASR
jgi:transcriptional regulator with XRE-family HTH domain